MQPSPDQHIYVGITPDIHDERYRVSRAVVRHVREAGGMPIILTCCPEQIPAYLRLCQAFVLTGGDDPSMERWGEPTHPKATPIHPDRQTFELALLDALDQDPARPAMGICLGMQLMGLHAGGELDQHLPDSLASAGQHWGHRPHAITGPLGEGVVHSHHRQALADAGSLRVIARAPDGVIEAVDHPDRAFYLGVQWHPERTDEPTLGRDLFRRLVAAARNTAVPG